MNPHLLAIFAATRPAAKAARPVSTAAVPVHAAPAPLANLRRSISG